MKEKYHCKECGKTIEADESENCCGSPMEKLTSCTTAPSAEHARLTNDDEPCDDGRSG